MTYYFSYILKQVKPFFVWLESRNIATWPLAHLRNINQHIRYFHFCHSLLGSFHTEVSYFRMLS